MSFRYYGAFTHIVVATVAVATTGPAVSTLYASLFSCCLKADSVCNLFGGKVEMFSQFRFR